RPAARCSPAKPSPIGAAWFTCRSTTMDDLDQLVVRAQQEFASAPTPAELENAKARFLGKAGRVTELLKALASLSVDEKKSRGALINRAKERIEGALQQRRQAMAQAELDVQLRA